MARFTYASNSFPQVLKGVEKEAKTPKPYIFNYPADLADFAGMISAAKKGKGAKDGSGDWIFVTIQDLESQDEALKIRNDVYELNRQAEGKPTLRSRIKSYTVKGKTFWLFGIRYLTDAEQATKDNRKAEKLANKDAVSPDQLAAILATMK